MVKILERLRRYKQTADPEPRRFVQEHLTRTSRGFAPSFYEGDGPLSAFHASIEEKVGDIRGKLEPADHLKLYEAGYFARGPVLEIGRLHGRSTVLLALGIRDGGAGRPRPGPGGRALVALGLRDSELGAHVTSIEYEDRYLPWARRHLKRRRVLGYATLLQGDSSSIVRTLDGPFDVVFVDGDHSYEGVMADIDAVRGRIGPQAVVMFHDYYHPLNETGEYGVARAVEERRDELGLAFRGRFGAIALFEHVAGG